MEKFLENCGKIFPHRFLFDTMQLFNEMRAHSSPTTQWVYSLSISFIKFLSFFISSLNRPNSICKALICLLTTLISSASVSATFFD